VPNPKPSSSVLNDPLVEDPRDPADRIVLGPATSAFASPRPLMKRRRGKKYIGKWGRRLLSLRNSRYSDSLRLRQPVSNRSVNDPRRRAKSTMDVTILGHYDGPWVNLPEHFPVTVLGYLHCHTRHEKGSATDQEGCMQTRHQGKREDTVVREGVFAWFTFTLSTARNISLERGCRLKILNALVLPCPVVTELNFPASFKLEPDEKPHCQSIVICTEVCERIDDDQRLKR